MLASSMATLSYAQHLGSSRESSTGGSTVLASGPSAIDWNPAACASIRGWMIIAGGYSFVGGGESGSPEFYGIGAGAGISDRQGAAFRITPGSSLDFVIPFRFVLEDSLQRLVTRYDRQIHYEEVFSLGYGYSPADGLSFGASLHSFEQKVSDTEYSVDSSSVIHAAPVEFSGSVIGADLGVLWSPGRIWRLGAAAHNVVRSANGLPDEARQYALAMPFSLTAGVSYAGIRNLIIGLDADTEDRIRFGGECDIPGIAVFRGVCLVDASSSFSSGALSFGFGRSIQSVTLDVGYRAYLSQENRRGLSTVTAFESLDIRHLDDNPFTGNRLSVSASVSLGRATPGLIRIEYVDVLHEIFPSSQALYALAPVATVRVRNLASKPAEVRARFFVDHLMDGPTESAPVTIGPQQTGEIPLFATFNTSIQSGVSVTVRDADVSVSASTDRGPVEDRRQTRILIRARNDWDGDVSRLRYFVTPRDSGILKFSRTYLSAYKALLDTVPAERIALEEAKILYNEFAARLLYVHDPKETADYVQYPSETLSLRGGDCDDLSVCYSAILGSIGVATAFVDVVPPDRPDGAHVYVLFDTGIDPGRAGLVSSNPKRYIVRSSTAQGRPTVWVPVETTLMSRGFEAAWAAGSQQYFDDVEVGLGLARGWVRLVDVGDAY